MNKKRSLHKFVISAASFMLVLTAVICTVLRIADCGIISSFNDIAAKSTLPAGNYHYIPSGAPSPENSGVYESNMENSSNYFFNSSHDENNYKSTSENSASEDFEISEPTDEEIRQYDLDHEGEERYPVMEFTSIQGNTAFAGVQVKNTASVDIDIEEELNSRLGFTIENNNEPQVLIYHTHTGESFLTYDTGYYYESFYPRSTDNRKNVCAVGEEIVKQLNLSGIKAIHDTTVHDNPSYTGAYYRSADTVNEYLKKYPSIKVVIDIHRDGIGTQSQRSKPVCTVDGKQAAQFMILSGYNCDNDPSFENWEYNLRFALQIQKNAIDMYPDLARPLNFGDFVYNMDINTGSLLIEVGADSNTIEEVKYTGYLLGKILSKTLTDAKQIVQ